MRRLFPLIRPLIFGMDPERAHRLAINGLKSGLVGGPGPFDHSKLTTTLFGNPLPNPIGLAAGFDKNAEAWRGIHKLGFGFLEVGTVTPKPQTGNPKPRLFRLEEDRALINRLGFNSNGADSVEAALQNSADRDGLLGINIGANKESADRIQGYVNNAKRFAPLADFLVINVSSPNTPGLRGLQETDRLSQLLDQVMAAVQRSATENATPVALKVAPELDAEARKGVVEHAIDFGLKGLVVSNTTTQKPNTLQSARKDEEGGLSGVPLFEASTDALRDYYRLARGSLELIGVGGITSAEDAYAKIRAGATAIELYTALIFEGPCIATKICEGLLELLERDGFSSIKDAVGTDHLSSA